MLAGRRSNFQLVSTLVGALAVGVGGPVLLLPPEAALWSPRWYATIYVAASCALAMVEIARLAFVRRWPELEDEPEPRGVPTR